MVFSKFQMSAVVNNMSAAFLLPQHAKETAFECIWGLNICNRWLKNFHLSTKYQQNTASNFKQIESSQRTC